MVVRIILVILIIVVVCAYLIFTRIAMPMWSFLTRRDEVFALYNTIYELVLSQEVIFKEDMEITLPHFYVKFSNTKEASILMEACINETLEYYDKLGWIAIVIPELRLDKEELYAMATEVRRLRLNYKN